MKIFDRVQTGELEQSPGEFGHVLPFAAEPLAGQGLSTWNRLVVFGRLDHSQLSKFLHHS
jgi:hypothetical protein